MAQDLFGFDCQRLLAASEIKPAHFDEFQRLCITLVHGSAFQLILVELYDQLYRDTLIAQLAQALQENQLSTAILALDNTLADIAELEARLLLLAKQTAVIHVIGGDAWFTPARWAELNLRRDTLARECQARLVFWLNPEQIKTCANQALDLWAWRSGVYEFDEAIATTPLQPDPHFAPMFTNLNQADRARRIAQLRAWLRSDPPPASEVRLRLLDELAALLFSLGQLDEALHIRQDEELPIYEQLGDVLGRAVTKGRIADILQARGQLDEALRIRREQELPVYEQLGDVRSLLVGQTNLAIGLIKQYGPSNKEAKQLLNQALNAARQMQLPESQHIARVMAEHHIPADE